MTEDRSGKVSTKGVPAPVSLRRNILFNTIGSLMYQGCQWLTTVLVVILSGYTDSGILALAMTVGVMFNPIGTYSMRTFQVSDVEGRYTHANYCAFRILTIAIGVALVSPYALFVSGGPSIFLTIFIYLLFKVDEAFSDVLYGVDQRAERMDYIGVSQFLRGVLIVLSFSCALFVAHSIDLAVFGMFVACALVTVMYDIPHALRFASLRPTISWADARSLLFECWPMVVATLLISMVVSVARQYYSYAFGVDQLGLYAAVATPAVLVQAMARFLYSPSLVPLAERWASGDMGSFISYLKKAALLMLAVVGFVAVGLSLAGPVLLPLVYGQSITDYVYLFPMVLVGTGLIAFLWLFSDVLIVCRDMRGLLVTDAAAFAVSLALVIPLEMLFGMNGINFVVVISMAAGLTIACARIAKLAKRQSVRS